MTQDPSYWEDCNLGERALNQLASDLLFGSFKSSESDDNEDMTDPNNLATPMARLGAHILEIVLAVATLGIGWLIWSFVVWGKGTTPAHQILKQYVIDEKTGKPFTWGKMCLREIVVKGLLGGLLSAITFGIFYVVDSLCVVRAGRQTIHDQICTSMVIQR